MNRAQSLQGSPRWKWMLLLTAGVLFAWAAPAGAEPEYNILLISVDGLRADHLEFYGYHRSTMPKMAKRVTQGVLFERVVTQASWTLPSFASLFTSRYMQDHGVNHRHRRLAAEEVLLVEVLREAGFRTAGFVGGKYLEPQYGFVRGFDIYRAGGSRLFTETAPQAARWIRENQETRFFVFLHGNDVHPPFNLPGSDESIQHIFDGEYGGSADDVLLDYYFVKVFNHYQFSESELPPDSEYRRRVNAIRSAPRDVEHIVAHYDGQIFAVDEALEPVFRMLEETGLDQETIVILTSDHGLEMGEKDKLGTAFHSTVWESINWVPLVIWHPDLEPLVIPEVVELVDVAPTLLELIGVDAPERYAGHSFAGLLFDREEAPGEERLAFGASSIVAPENRIRLHSVQGERWKLIYDVEGGTSGLYDLASDPGESSDISAQHPDVASRLLTRLLEHLGESTP